MRIALLSYRSKQHSGGQGVYVRHLSAGLAELGHEVTIFSGQPYPENLHPDVTLRKVPSLDLYRDEDPFRTPHWREFRDWIDVYEYLIMATAGFPEPRTFGLRMRRLDLSEFDIVHDNQSLSWGVLSIMRRQPGVATIHHPISRDRAVDLAAAPWRKRWSLRRWYGFVRMQAQVARRIPLLLGVSTVSAADTVDDFRLDAKQFRVVPLGVDTEMFAPTRARVANRIVVVASADKPLKGLAHFLEAAALLRASRDIDVHLVSHLDPDGPTTRRITEPDLAGAVTVHSGISDVELADLIASARVMVVPSLYEGFSLPAVEALACGTPLVASAAGALPETVGEAGVLVDPGEPQQIADEVERFFTDEAHWQRYSGMGRQRALDTYSWVAVARSTVEVYTEELARRGREMEPSRQEGPRHVDR